MFQLNFSTANGAFDPHVSLAETSQQLAHCLREVARKVEAGRTQGPIMDINGNSIGSFALTKAKE